MRWSTAVAFVLVSLVGGGAPTALAAADASEVAEIKRLLAEQEQMIRALRARVEELEGEGAAEPEAATPPVAAAPGEQEETAEAPALPPSPTEEVEKEVRLGRRAPVVYRDTLNDRQMAAARAGDYTLDPNYRGFIPVPNTALLIKFNAKPRVDFIGDSGNPGTDFRFVPSLFPSSTEQGWQFSANANGSQLSVDVVAPSVEGTPRFYYQNDFFGSNSSNMQYRLQHLYGEYAGFLSGFTFGVFEDPDAWPATVDYEGPNSVIFARRAVGQYLFEPFDDWEVTLSVEDPDIFVDTTGDPDARQRSRAPDTGFAIRWTPTEHGHFRLATIFRSIAVAGGTLGKDDVFGWGINTSGNYSLTSRDNVQWWFVYGQGVGGMGNDTSFVDSDAAFKTNGNLEALEYYSTMLALTHQWSPQWSTTLTHGYVNLENTGLQADDAYHETHYASVNLVYQMFKRLRIGIEGLYGYKKVKDGSDADDFRVQLGLAFAIFD